MFWNTLHDYPAKRPLVAYLRIRWTNVHRDIVSATVGHEDFQARWEGLMLTVAVRTWVTDESIGRITVVSDAEGILCDLVNLKARSPVINSLAKEEAVHLASFLRELQGLQKWSECNTLADTLSRLTAEESEPECYTVWKTPKCEPPAQALSDGRHCGELEARMFNLLCPHRVGSAGRGRARLVRCPSRGGGGGG